ncbi:LytTR family DNA-binding domain-containing protein [Alkalimonas collagenimarina]|uniref:LytTR family DNA-binding domain-containing protein n=1 Tax=Alkalimonas collagenimarina TaxID=400390 RepID=A0ABT9GXK0_9GAMM|nr:LytTR family DNA-binding domain-containing protein [Alkalimonas collagenimarina]MDP4535767.1 LytTR family DNA-binding domain-containing protein [Alkalimonas collagenimarina]
MTSGNSFLVQWVQRYPVLTGYLVFFLFLAINAAVNVSSTWTEHQRDPASELLLWQPMLWEYSSVVSTLLCSPLLFWWFKQHPLQFQAPIRQLLLHLAGSVLFSLSHVGIMVTLRSWVYQWLGSNYQFGPLSRELLYEYRKDVWAYVVFLCGYQLARFVYSRLQGEAFQLDTDAGEDSSTGDSGTSDDSTKAPGYFLVKKLDKEYLIRVGDIAWLEANGNYVNLHSKGRIYPMRATLAATMAQLNQSGFCRVHRSLAVNLSYIDSISYQSSGDGSISLSCGQQLPLSRRFKEDFKAAVAS